MNTNEVLNKLIAEIERRIANGQDGYGGNLKALLLFIASLQQEQQEVDLEKEMDKFYGMYRKDGKTYDITDNEEVSDWKEDGNFLFKIEFARHFYELGLNARKEE